MLYMYMMSQVHDEPHHAVAFQLKHCDMHSLKMRLPSNRPTGTFGDVKNIIQEISVLWLSTQDQLGLRNTTLY